MGLKSRCEVPMLRMHAGSDAVVRACAPKMLPTSLNYQGRVDSESRFENSVVSPRPGARSSRDVGSRSARTRSPLGPSGRSGEVRVRLGAASPTPRVSKVAAYLLIDRPTRSAGHSYEAHVLGLTPGTVTS